MRTPLSTPMAEPRSPLSVRETVLFALLAALSFAAKMAMAVLPNIEPVSLLVMLFAVTFRRKGLFPVGLYVLLEFLFWPMGLWNLNYLYIWFVLFAAALCLRRMRSALGWAVLSGAFGLCFGLLSAPVYAVTGGSAFAMTWWISGIPYDLLHCAGNFVMALVLFAPLRRLLDTLSRRFLV